jgi:hypothetical protein
MTEHRQTIFGEGGNCFATCVACLLDLAVEDVPNFVTGEDWWEDFQKWLEEKNLFAIEIDCEVQHMRNLPLGQLAILTGEANRGLLHCVIAAYDGVDKNGYMQWRFIHDPHPDDTYIKKIEYICFIVRQL